jgi:hypothetical protein
MSKGRGSKFCEKWGKKDFYRMFTKVLISKSLQLEKTDPAKSKNDIGKGLCSPARPGSFAACTLK